MNEPDFSLAEHKAARAGEILIQRAAEMRTPDWSLAESQMAMAADSFAYELSRPSTIHRPRLSIDGNQWCALHGADLQDGVAGFGDSPELAYVNFDRNWNRKFDE